MTWTDEGSANMQAQVSRVCRRIGKKLGCVVVPAGEIWKSAFDAEPGIKLHGSDGHHAGDAGSYLSACTFYTILLAKSPIGLPYRLKDPSCGQYLLSISPALADRLQNLVFRRLRNELAQDTGR